MEPVAFFKPLASPPPLASGKAALYEAADGSLRYRLSTGVEVNLSAAPAAAAAAFPVGAVFIAVVSTNPATLLGYGTWSAFGTGRMLVGFDGSQTEFDTVEETGGAKSITQTVAQMAVHTHIQDVHTHTQNSHNHTQDPHGHTQDPKTIRDVVGAALGFGGGTNGQGGSTANATATNQAATATNQNTTATNQNAGGTAGVTDPMPILNPYIVVYMWKRTV